MTPGLYSELIAVVPEDTTLAPAPRTNEKYIVENAPIPQPEFALNKMPGLAPFPWQTFWLRYSLSLAVAIRLALRWLL
jgi:hypothetical protein